MYAVFSYEGGWCRLWQFPTVSEWEAGSLLNRAKRIYPYAKLKVERVED